MSAPPKVKVCGLGAPEAVAAAVEGGASHLGFVFYPPSPRAVAPARAGELARAAAGAARRVAVAVDPTDAEIARIVAALAPDLLQLHGRETPERTAEIGRRFGAPTMKAIRVSTAADIAGARAWEGAADALLFDARPPPGAVLPGGNGRAFDWTLLAGFESGLPWFLSGGLDAANVAGAIRAAAPPALDVSSGVEDRPGVKNTGKIAAFLAAVRAAAAPKPAESR